MKIMPMVSSGEPIMREDGSIEVAPVQVFRSVTGMTVIRVGRTALFFDEHGRYDGYEFKVPEHVGRSDAAMQAIERAMADTLPNRGKAPTESYFDEGTDGRAAEVRGWPGGKGQN